MNDPSECKHEILAHTVSDNVGGMAAPKGEYHHVVSCAACGWILTAVTNSSNAIGPPYKIPTKSPKK